MKDMHQLEVDITTFTSKKIADVMQHLQTIGTAAGISNDKLLILGLVALSDVMSRFIGTAKVMFEEAGTEKVGNELLQTIHDHMISNANTVVMDEVRSKLKAFKERGQE